MIFLDSRYADGTILKAYDARNGSYQLTVFRNFPRYYTSYLVYEWVETDRIDDIALQFLGKSELWWEIMDINPEVLDPFNIAPGTLIRIPRE
jgi:hypothetical protein